LFWGGYLLFYQSLAVRRFHSGAHPAQFPLQIARATLIRMRTPLALFLLLSGTALAAGDAKFAGTWQAAAGDKVFLVLKLQQGAKISGTLNAGSISIDDEGNLKEAGPVGDHESPIFFARAEGDKLEFDFQDEDDEVMHFELKLTSAGSAELRIVDKHYPKMKAFALKKK
jgi:hypothetical protein